MTWAITTIVGVLKYSVIEVFCSGNMRLYAGLAKYIFGLNPS